MRTERLRNFLLLSLLLLACCTTSNSSSEPGATPGSSPKSKASVEPSATSTTTSGGEQQLLFMERKSLRAWDVASGSFDALGRLPSTDVSANADGSMIAYVTSAAPATEQEDFITEPELHLYETDTGDDITIGPGFSPLWQPEGDRLAYLEPREVRVCEGETCEGTNALVVADVATAKRTTWLESGAFVPLSWLGDRVIVSQQVPKPATLAVSESGAIEKLSIAPSEFWGASPDGTWLVRSITERVEFVAVDGSDRLHVPLPGSVLGEGAWSPDSRRLAAVSLDARGGEETGLRVLGPKTDANESISGSEGASGPVLWSPDGSSFAYVRATGPGGLDLEAVLCQAPSSEPSVDRCDPLFSWTRGVTLLALK